MDLDRLTKDIHDVLKCNVSACFGSRASLINSRPKVICWLGWLLMYLSYISLQQLEPRISFLSYRCFSMCSSACFTKCLALHAQNRFDCHLSLVVCIIDLRLNWTVSFQSESNGIAVCIMENMNEFEAFLKGPAETPYKGGTFKIHVSVPKEYPMKPPTVSKPNLHASLQLYRRTLNGFLPGNFWNQDLASQYIVYDRLCLSRHFEYQMVCIMFHLLSNCYFIVDYQNPFIYFLFF